MVCEVQSSESLRVRLRLVYIETQVFEIADGKNLARLVKVYRKFYCVAHHYAGLVCFMEAVSVLGAGREKTN